MTKRPRKTESKSTGSEEITSPTGESIADIFEETNIIFELREFLDESRTSAGDVELPPEQVLRALDPTVAQRALNYKAVAGSPNRFYGTAADIVEGEPELDLERVLRVLDTMPSA